MKSKLIGSVAIYLGVAGMPFRTSAQNIVPNPGFELYDSLPCNFTQYSSEFALYLDDWFLPTGGTSDIISTQISSACNYGNPNSLNSCGLQYPHSGDAMTGMVAQSFTWYDEYLEVQLTNPLVPGKRYYFECFLLFGDCSNFASNNFGAALSVNQYIDTTIVGYINRLPVVQDSSIKNNPQQWEKISGCFEADSAYQYLLLGHFQNNCDTSSLHTGSWPYSYYFVDDVFLAEDSTCETTTIGCQVNDYIDDVSQSSIAWSIENNQLRLYSKNFRGSVTVYSVLGNKVMNDCSFSEEVTLGTGRLVPGIYVAVIVDSRNQMIDRIKFVR